MRDGDVVQGEITHVRLDKGFCFATIDGGDETLFIYARQFSSDDDLVIGNRVRYLVGLDYDGRLCGKSATVEGVAGKTDA
jgi:cold shock CspA family protein